MDETLKRKAYLDGMNLKKFGLEYETIYARLEKSGIPAELASQVVKDLFAENHKASTKQAKEAGKISLIILLIGGLTALLSVVLLPQSIIVPTALIIYGIVGLIRASRS